MSNFILTPNMNLPNPVPGVDPGPDYADNQVSCFNILDGHNHAPGSGVLINSDGLNINADLTFNSNNAVSLRSVRFSPQPSAISGASDLGCLYEAGVDLYYNDGVGNQIRITQGGNVAGSSGTITGLPSGTASAAYVSGTGTFVFQQATSTGANLDVASVAIRYPGSYPTPSGNYIQIQAPTSLASGYSITLPALPGSTLPLLLSSAGIMSTSQIGTAQIANVAVTAAKIALATITNAQIATGTIIQSSMEIRSTGTTVGAGGVAVSASSSNFSTNNTSPTPVTNLSVTITTLGNPVKILLIGDGGVNPSLVGLESHSDKTFNGYFYSGVTQISNQVFETTSAGVTPNGTAVNGPPSAFQHMDFPSAGTYTYTFQIATGDASFAAQCFYAKLVAYEIK